MLNFLSPAPYRRSIKLLVRPSQNIVTSSACIYIFHLYWQCPSNPTVFCSLQHSVVEFEWFFMILNTVHNHGGFNGSPFIQSIDFSGCVSWPSSLHFSRFSASELYPLLTSVLFDCEGRVSWPVLSSWQMRSKFISVGYTLDQRRWSSILWMTNALHQKICR